MVHQIILDATTSKVVMIAKTETWLKIFPWIGGWFAFLWAISSFLFSIFMNYLTYLNIIIKLFRMDPSKGQTPRDPLAVEKAEPGDLITMA